MKVQSWSSLPSTQYAASLRAPARPATSVQGHDERQKNGNPSRRPTSPAHPAPGPPAITLYQAQDAGEACDGETI